MLLQRIIRSIRTLLTPVKSLPPAINGVRAGAGSWSTDPVLSPQTRARCLAMHIGDATPNIKEMIK